MMQDAQAAPNRWHMPCSRGVTRWAVARGVPSSWHGTWRCARHGPQV